MDQWSEADPEGSRGSSDATGAFGATIAADTTTQLAAQTTGLNASALVGTVPGLNFNGISATGAFPTPDANGAVGATQYVQYVNAQFAVYSKATGTLLLGPVSGNSLFSGFGGPCQTNNSGDPIVLYDQAAMRWVFSRHATPSGGPYFHCIAVSTSSDATGTYNRYAFALPGQFPDYPKLGVWSDGYYFTADLLDQNNKFVLTGVLTCAFDRSAMIANLPAKAVCFQLDSTFHSLLPADLDGSNPPPVGVPNILLSLGTNALAMWKFHVDFTTTSNSQITGPVLLAVNSFTPACGGKVCVQQLGTSQQLDSLADRLMYRLAYRRVLTSPSHGSLLVTHTVGSPPAIRWYEIWNPGGTPTIHQQGTYRPDGLARWMASMAMDKVGNIAVGYSVSGSTIFPSIRFTGRLATDPLGTLEGEQVIINGNAAQEGSNRWGDYTAIAVDPVDDCTFWYTNEYENVSGSFNWKTRIASFKFPSCK
jgi:hypothetical protein